ncbi:MAG: hypothetical protein IOC94_18155, partial [Methylocystis sp.]|nr:hypothetical protein [Methylocystis sp.]
MLVPRDDALRFIDGYRTMLLRVLADTGTAASEDPLVDLAAARSLGKDNPGLFEAALCSLAADGRALEPAIATAIRSLTIGLWFYLRQGKTYAVMLDGELQNAYAVR